jgi:hypothetical protein
MGNDPLDKTGQGMAGTAVEARQIAEAAYAAKRHKDAELEAARDLLAKHGLDPDMVQG